MTTKQWFQRSRRLDAHINSLLVTRDRLWESLTATTARYSGDVVDGTRDPHKNDSLIVLEDMIDREVDRLRAMKLEIYEVIKQLEGVDTLCYDLLMKRYIDCKKWENVAVELGYDYYYVKGALHGKALKLAEPFIVKKDTE